MIIIARYNENISWTKDLQVPYIIYNKGNDYIEGSKKLENKGNESDTYLRHIIDNYDNLEGTLYFIQGMPFDHMESVIIGKESGGFNTNKGMNKDIIDFFNNYKILEDFIHLGKLYCCDLSGRPHSNLKLEDFIENIFEEFPEDVDQLYFTQGAHFAVTANRIKTKPIEFYKNVLKELHKDVMPNGHIMERLWTYIFSNKTK